MKKWMMMMIMMIMVIQKLGGDDDGDEEVGDDDDDGNVASRLSYIHMIHIQCIQLIAVLLFVMSVGPGMIRSSTGDRVCESEIP